MSIRIFSNVFIIMITYLIEFNLCINKVLEELLNV